MRTFIAVGLESHIQDALRNFIQELKSIAADIKWVPSGNIHLTLKFLGEIPPARVPDIEAGIRQAAGRHAPFELDFKGTGTFPANSSRPRVIWAGIERSAGLLSLQSELENSMAQLGFPAEKRKYSPHLTLGRVRSSTRIKPLLEQLRDHRDIIFGRMVVQQVIFFKSVLKPSGAEYSRIFNMDLK